MHIIKLCHEIKQIKKFCYELLYIVLECLWNETMLFPFYLVKNTCQTQVETGKLQKVCCWLVTLQLQSSSRHQDAFASLALAWWCRLIVKIFYLQAWRRRKFDPTTCSKCANIKWHQIWFSKIWRNLMKPTDLMQLDTKLALSR